MIIYKVELCLQLALSRLKKFSLKEYATERPIIFVEAKDPDDACHQATSRLINHILSQDDSIENKLMCRDMMQDIRVIKVFAPT